MVWRREGGRGGNKCTLAVTGKYQDIKEEKDPTLKNKIEPFARVAYFGNNQYKNEKRRIAVGKGRGVKSNVGEMIQACKYWFWDVNWIFGWKYKVELCIRVCISVGDVGTLNWCGIVIKLGVSWSFESRCDYPDITNFVLVSIDVTFLPFVFYLYLF